MKTKLVTKRCVGQWSDVSGSKIKRYGIFAALRVHVSTYCSLVGRCWDYFRVGDVTWREAIFHFLIDTWESFRPKRTLVNNNFTRCAIFLRTKRVAVRTGTVFVRANTPKKMRPRHCKLVSPARYLLKEYNMSIHESCVTIVILSTYCPLDIEQPPNPTSSRSRHCNWYVWPRLDFTHTVLVPVAAQAWYPGRSLCKEFGQWKH